jgi:hypothetical protein
MVVRHARFFFIETRGYSGILNAYAAFTALCRTAPMYIQFLDFIVMLVKSLQSFWWLDDPNEHGSGG